MQTELLYEIRIWREEKSMEKKKEVVDIFIKVRKKMERSYENRENVGRGEKKFQEIFDKPKI